MTNKELLKKQIIYRSTHRGSKEMDLLLGNFVKRYIKEFNDTELKELDKLLKIDDELLQRWYFEKNAENLIPSNKVSVLLKEFKF